MAPGGASAQRLLVGAEKGMSLVHYARKDAVVARGSLHSEYFTRTHARQELHRREVTE